MKRLVGVDGCRGGWLVVEQNYTGRSSVRFAPTAWIAPTIAHVIGDFETVAAAVIDIPIGLLDTNRTGGRTCEQHARKLLAHKSSSIFNSPVRAVLECKDYDEARDVSIASGDIGKSLTKQTWNIVPKIKEVDSYLRSHPEVLVRLSETQSELIFLAMNRVVTGGGSLVSSKKTREGRLERESLLRAVGFETIPTVGDIPGSTRAQCVPDDIIDACASLWTADRFYRRTCEHAGDANERDSCSLPMLMRF
ncbi:MAG: DUF429 domain-containing protein [Phycisphaeraceae bacterium]|nr:DUF429 domain-containing protein [Phycisphaerales bacterium]MCB9861139.1 DUF429 domain-containing protein [Phycisphaeraceae bacterium]